MSDRGKIRHREYSTQVNDFSGLLFGKITPTDIDLFVEFGDKLYIFGEVKYQGADMPQGQALALARLCDICHNSGRTSALLIISHNSGGDVDVSSAIVTKYRFQKEWHIPARETTVRQAIEILRREAGLE